MDYSFILLILVLLSGKILFWTFVVWAVISITRPKITIIHRND